MNRSAIASLIVWSALIGFGAPLACSSSNKAAADGGIDANEASADTATDTGPPSLISHPNPIISQGQMTFPASAAAVDDGKYHNGGWTTPVANLPASAAIHIGAGPTRLLVQWDDGGTYNYKDPAGTTVYGFPMGYTIDVSGDTTNGSDGTWASVITVTDNAVRTRGHVIDFTGMTWVRMTITAAPATESANGVQIGEIDVYDISASPDPDQPDDTWFFMGDSITAFAYDRAQAHQPSFAALIHTALPDYFPAMIDGGIGGEVSAQGLARLPEALSLNSAYRFFVLGYGTNDANRGTTTATYQSNMQMMIDMVKAAGKIPIIPRIPYSANSGYLTIDQFNPIVDALVTSNNLIAGPDFYAFFMANPADFTCPPCGTTAPVRQTDNLHPNDVGLAAMNQLWADAAQPLYPASSP